LEEALVIEQLLPVQRFAGALAQIVLVVFALVAGELLPHLLGGAEPGTGLAELARGRLLPHLRQAQQDGQSLRGASFGHFSDSLSGQRPAAAPAGRNSPRRRRIRPAPAAGSRGSPAACGSPRRS